MTAKEFADLLSGRDYMNEITQGEEEQAKAAGLVAVFGYSEDNMEFRGAIDDEVGCYDGGIVYITKDGVLDDPDCDGDDCPYFAAAKKNATPIKAVWHDNGPGPAWTYETDIPHETFEIYDDGDTFCVGIVFSMEDVNGKGMQELIEKNTPKKPIKASDSRVRYTEGYRCPTCGGAFTGTGIADYCYHCGQRLDWEGLSDA